MPDWYAVAHPGLEAVVADELRERGLRPSPVPGGVRFQADVPTGADLARALRTPDRLLLEVAKGRAHTLDELVGVVRRGAWKPVLDPDATIEVHATTKTSRLHFTDTIEKKVAWALRECLKGPRVIDGRPRPRVPQRVQVRIDSDEVTLSVDAAGELLHRRGWRKETAKAPIRENLAASLLRLARWTGDEPLVDPFCGSGTLLIEAAFLASGRSPFVGRAFACDEWPALARRKRPNPRPTGLAPLLLGADRDAGAIAAATENAARAKVEVKWAHLDVADLQAPAPTGLVLTNPPWGVRVAPTEAGSVYARLGRTVRERFQGWRVVFLAPAQELAQRVHRDVRPMVTFPSGGIRVTVWGVDV